MLYRYDGCPLYQEQDTEAAINDIYEYLIGNNKQESRFVYHDPTIETPEIIKPELVKDSIRLSYGVNVTTMANFLSVQNMYFSRYMDNIIKYLHYCGQSAYIETFKPQFLTTFAIIKLVSTKHKILDYWNPNIKWTNFNYADDIAKNAMNPINIFYKSGIVFKNASKDFVEYLGQDTDLIDMDKALHVQYPTSISVRLLPTCNPVHIINMMNCIHNYF